LHEFFNFSVEPTKLGFVLLHMLLHGPILNVVEIIESKIDKVFLSSCDIGKERAAENRHR
jgi:hypothetical protein